MLMARPIERMIEALESHGCEPKRRGNGWSAKCPAHDDRQASLSIGEGDDGRALVKCFAGCSAESVVAALGLTIRDLMPEDDAPRGSALSRGNGKPKSNGNGANTPRQNGQVFATAKAAVAALEERHGKRSALWTYHDADGKPAGLIVRWDTPDGKTVRPVSRMANGWTIGAMPEPRPLYRLPKLRAAPLDTLIVVCEGEKAADAALRCGLPATTSSGGAQAATKTDWSPMKGRSVIVLPDHDAAGERYAADVARLCYAAEAASVKILRLSERCPSLPEGGDLADVLDSPEWCGAPLGDAATPEDCGRWLLDWAASIEAEPNPTAANAELAEALEWQPYPVEALPPVIQRFVIEEATALGCEPAMVAVPLLTALGAAIGTTRRVIVKRGWRPYPILWSAIVAESGQLKSPALRAAMQWAYRQDDEALEAVADAQAAYKQAKAAYDAEFAAWRRKPEGVPPIEPEAPTVRQYVVSDTTVEAVAPILRDNPRGVLLCRDELAGWFGSHDRYSQTRGGDVAAWLSAYNGECWKVNRKTSGTIHVPRAAVWITGGIQPRILSRVLTEQNRENGLAARFLFVAPPPRPKRFTEAAASPEAIEAVGAVFSRLFRFDHAADDQGRPVPEDVPLSPEAKEAYEAFYNRHGEETAELTGDLAAAGSKLEELPGRLALILHFVRLASGEFVEADAIDADSMRAAIVLTEWHKLETRRVYHMLDATPEEREQQRLIDWIRRHGGEATPREVQQGCRWLREPGAAEAAPTELAQAGLGQWTTCNGGEGGGRPTRRFRLSTTPPCLRNPQKQAENRGFVDVDNVGAAPEGGRQAVETPAADCPEDVNRMFAEAAETDRATFCNGD